ncbi:MAG: YdcF family protein [Anaerolineae bacterium]
MLCGALGAALVGWPYRHAIEVARSRTYTAASVPHRSAALVFGAGIWPDGSPTPILYDRVRTAAELYAAGKVDGVVMSGAVGANGRDEPVTMARLAEAFGVPARAITLDGNGTSTFGSCAGWLADRMRRRSNEGVVLVTQAYHMPRALLACGWWDPAIVGVSADRRRYPALWMAWWRLREWPATLKLLWRLRRHRS